MASNNDSLSRNSTKTNDKKVEKPVALKVKKATDRRFCVSQAELDRQPNMQAQAALISFYDRLNEFDDFVQEKGHGRYILIVKLVTDNPILH